MYSAETLYDAVLNNNIDLLSNAAIADYGFMCLDEKNYKNLFYSYQAVSKFMYKAQFITIMHQALLNDSLYETMNNLTNTIPKIFQNHWNEFVENNNKID